MSKVADIMNSNEAQQCTKIFFDPDSIDSLLGAAILKYACEEITNVNETLSIEPISNVNNGQSYSYEAGGETFLFNKNITFVGCVPDKDMISYLASIHKKDLLFVLCDEDQYAEVKGYGASIEYSTEDSCALLLYKIIFGELSDGIPDIIKIVSKGVMKQYDDDYETYLRFFYGFLLKYLPVADYVRLNNIYTDIKPALFDKTVTDITDYTGIMNNGLDILTNINKVLATHMSGIKSDVWKVNGEANGFAFFGNGPMLPESIGGASIETYFPLDILITFYRKNKNYWVVELFKSVSQEKIGKVNENNERLEEIETLMSYDDSSLDDDNKKVLETEKKNLIAENKALLSVIDFDCGQYLKKFYKGGGTKEHGFAKVANKNLLKIVEKRAV